jgi:hypothetical protein
MADDTDDRTRTEDEIREMLAGPHGDGRSAGDLERELPIGPADDGGGFDQGPGTTSRGTGGDAAGGTTGGAIDAKVSQDSAVEQGSLEEEAVPEDVERLRRGH